MPSDNKPTHLSRRAFIQSCTAMGWVGFATHASVAHATSLHVGAPAPIATLVTLDGQRITTTDLLGHVVIVTFWATWCEPCLEELPLLSGYAASHAAQGLTVLGFCLDSPDTLQLVKQRSHALRFPVGLLSNSSAPGYGRIWRCPVSFTIDRSGRLVDNGWNDKQPAWTTEKLERIVTPLLNATA